MPSAFCPYCDGPHEWHACDVIFTPIIDCEFKDKEDGTCMNPKNMTPECHDVACPRLDRRLMPNAKDERTPAPGGPIDPLVGQG